MLPVGHTSQMLLLPCFSALSNTFPEYLKTTQWKFHYTKLTIKLKLKEWMFFYLYSHMAILKIESVIDVLIWANKSGCLLFIAPLLLRHHLLTKIGLLTIIINNRNILPKGRFFLVFSIQFVNMD